MYCMTAPFPAARKASETAGLGWSLRRRSGCGW